MRFTSRAAVLAAAAFTLMAGTPVLSEAAVAPAPTLAGPAHAVRLVTPDSTSCTISLNAPTRNGFGNVIGTSSVVCTANVQQIYLVTQLYYDGTAQGNLYYQSEAETGEDTFSSLNGSTGGPGPTGQWTTGVWVQITFTPGDTQTSPVYFSNTVTR
jgi:hypothetical protein